MIILEMFVLALIRVRKDSLRTNFKSLRLVLEKAIFVRGSAAVQLVLKTV